jgi:hypothetical protein
LRIKGLRVFVEGSIHFATLILLLIQTHFLPDFDSVSDFGKRDNPNANPGELYASISSRAFHLGLGYCCPFLFFTHMTFCTCNQQFLTTIIQDFSWHFSNTLEDLFWSFNL